MKRTRWLTALTLATLASCVPSPPEPAPAPVAVPTFAPAPEPTPVYTPPPMPEPTYSHWLDAPQTPGDWFYEALAPYSYAAFGPAPKQPIAAFRCDRPRRIVSIGRSSSSLAAKPLTIRTETQSRTFIAEPRQGSVEHLLAIDLPADDPLLDAIAFSKGRFAIEVTGEPTLYLPAWPEINRVIDDCR